MSLSRIRGSPRISETADVESVRHEWFRVPLLALSYFRVVIGNATAFVRREREELESSSDGGALSRRV